MISGLMRFGDIEGAEDVFKSMKYRDSCYSEFFNISGR
ncbi:hypothetical protein CASFOL_030036 [Castilleja foliolosa]|uniref:Pentatricopeptide repeat-containing protein n=1 Tax=Castilleja foliolosa TaxID=1961234 RepID=A0ABD3CA95_9LAMI